MKPMALTTTTPRRLALSEAEIALVCSLYQHRVCSTSQLHAMHTSHASLRWARKLLARLHQAAWSTGWRTAHRPARACGS